MFKALINFFLDILRQVAIKVLTLVITILLTALVVWGLVYYLTGFNLFDLV